MSGWVPFEQQLCDLCNRVACWRHPAGGLRCTTCPRPESGKKPAKGRCRRCGETDVKRKNGRCMNVPASEHDWVEDKT